MVGSRGRIASIQGLRAIAILLVVAYHLGIPIGAGLIGVDVFFVISGFVITRMILNRSQESHRLSLPAFWAGRIRRLLPALAAMCVLTALFAIPFTSPVGTQSQTGLTAVAANGWFSNGYLALVGSSYFASNAGDNPLMHTWSLAVEEQFYVFFPLMVVAALWWTRRRGGASSLRIGRWMAVVGVISFALCLFLTFVRLPLPVGQLLAFYSPMTRAWEFAAGAVLAVAFHRGWKPGRWAQASIPVGIALIVVGLIVTDGGLDFPGWFPLLPDAGTVLLLIGAVTGTFGLPLLNNRPMVYIGDISYSWYLFHWPVIVFATTSWSGDLPVWMSVVAAIVGFALAAASYRWLEQPIRTRRVLPRMRTPILAALAIVPTLVASSILIAGAHQGWGNADVRSMQAQLDHGQWQYQKVCQSPEQLTKRDMAACVIKGDPNKRPLILVGDSNAGVYADMMVRVAADLHRTVTIATVPSCSLTDVASSDLHGLEWLDCDDFYQSSMKWLAQHPNSTVVIADGLAAVDYSGLALRASNGDVIKGRAQKQAAYQASLERTYRALKAMGDTVVQIERIPHFLTWRPQLCTLTKMLRDGAASCGTQVSLTKADEQQSGALAAEVAATKANRVPVINLRNTLCPNGTCRTNSGNTWYYEDGEHLSFSGAMSLENLFVTALQAR